MTVLVYMIVLVVTHFLNSIMMSSIWARFLYYSHVTSWSCAGFQTLLEGIVVNRRGATAKTLKRAHDETTQQTRTVTGMTVLRRKSQKR